MAAKCVGGHINQVVCGDGKVVRAEALGDSGWADDGGLQGVNGLNFHANFKTMNSGLEVILRLNTNTRDGSPGLVRSLGHTAQWDRWVTSVWITSENKQ